jgi:uncharacterized damage-inducible protein DinB
MRRMPNTAGVVGSRKYNTICAAEVSFVLLSFVLNKLHTMEITSVISFIDYYGRLRERTLRILNIVPRDKMDWAYKPGKFTIADMIRHIAAIERNMFAENVMLRPTRYNGCGKELADGYDVVLDYFKEMHYQSVAIFKTLTTADLKRKCPYPGGEITTWKWLRALTEHEIHHRGELYIYLNLLDVKTPPMFGLTAEEVQMRNLK